MLKVDIVPNYQLSTVYRDEKGKKIEHMTKICKRGLLGLEKQFVMPD